VRGSSFDQVYQGEARVTDKTSAKMKSPLTVSRTKWWKKTRLVASYNPKNLVI